jgi:hypothetical protein
VPETSCRDGLGHAHPLPADLVTMRRPWAAGPQAPRLDPEQVPIGLDGRSAAIAMHDGRGHRPPPLPLALTIATMPARTASGSCSQRSTISPKPGSSGSARVAFWVAVGGRIGTAIGGFWRERSSPPRGLPWRKPPGIAGYCRVLSLAGGGRRGEAPGGFEPPVEVLQTSALPLGYGAETVNELS